MAKFRVGEFVEYKGRTYLVTLCRVVFGVEFTYLYDLKGHDATGNGFAYAIEETYLCPTKLETITD